MAEILRPATAEEARQAVAWAVAEATPLKIVGAGTKRGFGHEVTADHRLDLSGLSGITAYEPAELVLTAGPGTPLAEIEAALRQSRQQLAFEPPDLGPLLGAAAESGTIGGAWAANLSGPRRILAGAARDHALGLVMVTGRGELVKAGGKVVKNVTGYDVTKLMCGSWGTLGVLTEVTVKVLPAPERLRTVLVAGLEPEAAVACMGEALASPHEVSAAAYVPADVAARSAVGYVASAGASITALRLEGPPVSVGARNEALKALFAQRGALEELHSHNSLAFWRELRDAALVAPGAPAVWRLSVPPASGAVVLRALEAAGGSGWLDWGGGLVWWGCAATQEAAAAVRGAAVAAGGHATLVRAPETLKRAVGVFQPQDAGRRALSRRIREGFDPRGVLNPGRMGGEG